MKANEFSKRGLFSTKYALGVSMAIEGDKTVESEMTLARGAIIQWLASRGKSASEILITVVAPADDHESIAKSLTGMARKDSALMSAVEKVPLKVELVASDSKAKITFRLS